ncbi:response regulator transcription factor [Desulforegula conservatrix]|uniref:response regulator transcription factor n=1 Tax=Desulforegula conservatrix TaxID=153026 RepID=UPI0003FB95B4|nr:response regulator transcription factor [Desulforegula conservatrix]
MADKFRVVVADDENHIRMFIKSVLKTIGAEIVGEAKNGNEAIDIFRKTRPDLLLMDINMPEKTGDEALIDIMKEFPDACVIMMTSVSDIETVQQCIEKGASHYIRKDTPIDQIKEIILETLNINKGE